MQVNIHFVMLEEFSDTLSETATGEGTVARISIVRECTAGDVEFDGPEFDTNSQN